MGIFDAPMTFEQPTEFEGFGVDIPDAIVNVLPTYSPMQTCEKSTH
jgi:hypothetical protein